MRPALLLATIVAASVGSGCAARAFVRPAGPERPAPEAAAALADATATCAPVSSYAAGLGLTGQIGSRKIRSLAGATLDVAVTTAGQIGVEARVSSQFVFRLGGAADRAVLVLEDRIVTAPADAIVEALIGVKVGPERLLAILTGCVSTSPALQRAGRFGEVIEISAPDAVVYLERSSERWRVRAGRFGEFAVEYASFDRDMPREVRLRSIDSRTAPVSLTFRVKTFEANPALPASAFFVSAPPDSKPMSLDELRQDGPLGPSSDSR